MYDKLTKKIWRTKPENAFFENHRNTGIIQFKEGDKLIQSDDLEKAFADVDSSAAHVIEIIRQSKSDDWVLSNEQLLRVRYFINSMFWRSPANEELKKTTLKSQSFKNLNNGYFVVKTEDGYREPDEIYHVTDLLQKLYSIFLPGASFDKDYSRHNSKDWRLYYGGASHGLIGDNPVIHAPFQDFSSLHEDIIFKISSAITLVSTARYKPDVLSPLFSTRVDFLLYQQAKRYVASNNKNYLEQMVFHFGEFCKKPGWAEGLFKNIFDAFY